MAPTGWPLPPALPDVPASLKAGLRGKAVLQWIPLPTPVVPTSTYLKKMKAKKATQRGVFWAEAALATYPVTLVAGASVLTLGPWLRRSRRRDYELLSRIQAQLLVPVLQQRLVYGGRSLQDVELGEGALTALHSAASAGEVPLELTLLVRSPAAAEMLATVRRNALALKHAAAEFTQDKEVVIAAMTTNPWAALKYAADELKRDKEFVMAAIARDPCAALTYATDELKRNKEVVMAAMAVNPWAALEHAACKFKSDKEFVMAAIAKAPHAALVYAADELKRDREVVMAAIAQAPRAALEYAADELKRDKDFVMTAIAKAPCAALKYATDELRRDKEVILAAVARDHGALRYAATELRRDTEVLAAVEQNF